MTKDGRLVSRYSTASNAYCMTRNEPHFRVLKWAMSRIPPVPKNNSTLRYRHTFTFNVQKLVKIADKKERHNVAHALNLCRYLCRYCFDVGYSILMMCNVYWPVALCSVEKRWIIFCCMRLVRDNYPKCRTFPCRCHGRIKNCKPSQVKYKKFERLQKELQTMKQMKSILALKLKSIWSKA